MREMFKVGDSVWNKKKKCLDTVQDVMYESYVLESDIRFTVGEQDLHQTADDMFEALEYEKRDKVYGKRNASWYETIEFYNNYYTHTEWHEDEEETRAVPTTIEEHQAIHQKLIEMGLIK